MTKKLIKCGKCDLAVPMTRLVSEEVLMLTATGQRLGVQRTFEGVCPDHGKFWRTLTAHHVSVGRRQRKRGRSQKRKMSV
jgi:hypothetical protein